MSHESEWGARSYSVRTGAPKTLADDAFLRLRDDIVKGALKPGEKLKPDLLSARHGIGLSPIREALSRLASDGLAVAEGQRGFFVAPISLGELADVAELRKHFSVMAFERSIRAGDEAWEAAIVAAYYQLNKLVKQMKASPAVYAEEWERRNRAFHAALESACGSPWLLHFCQILYDQSERYRRNLVAYPKIAPRIYDEHKLIMEAALKRDAKAACRVLETHIRLGAEAVAKLLRARLAAEGADAAPKPARKRISPRAPTSPQTLPR
ncbi:MAG: FCD domain-containing protein [Rhodospirillaceae bacterium]|nr:FCD domain-containing protein [Rhodospirillaceae bacterium]